MIGKHTINYIKKHLKENISWENDNTTNLPTRIDNLVRAMYKNVSYLESMFSLSSDKWFFIRVGNKEFMISKQLWHCDIYELYNYNNQFKIYNDLKSTLPITQFKDFYNYSETKSQTDNFVEFLLVQNKQIGYGLNIGFKYASQELDMLFDIYNFTEKQILESNLENELLTIDDCYVEEIDEFICNVQQKNKLYTLRWNLEESDDAYNLSPEGVYIKN